MQADTRKTECWKYQINILHKQWK